MKLQTTTVFVVAALGLISCSDALAPSSTTRHQPIKDGTTDPDTTSVFALIDSEGRFCSAVLIAPHLVLTGRNCVASVGDSGVVCDSTTFSSTEAASDLGLANEANVSSNSDWITPTDVIVGEDDGVCGNDIAVLVLSEPVAASTATPIAPALTADLMAGASYDFYGYGHDGTGAGSGTRRTSTGEVTCVGTDCESFATATEFIGEDGACQGDGGGPAVSDGRVIGLSSRGGGSCDYSVHTMVGSHSEFLVAAAEQATEDTGHPLPEWAGGEASNNTATNNATTNNATTNNVGGTDNGSGSNNDSGANNNTDTTDGTSDDSGCSTSAGSGLGDSIVVLVFAFVVGLLRRR